jgi:hypothetical protein
MPVYEDAMAVRSSIERLRALTSREAVAKLAGAKPSADRMELCRLVVGELGLPPAAANPLVAAPACLTHSKIAASEPAMPVSMRQTLAPKTRYAYTNRSTFTPGATGTVNGILSA